MENHYYYMIPPNVRLELTNIRLKLIPKLYRGISFSLRSLSYLKNFVRENEKIIIKSNKPISTTSNSIVSHLFSQKGFYGVTLELKNINIENILVDTRLLRKKDKIALNNDEMTRIKYNIKELEELEKNNPIVSFEDDKYVCNTCLESEIILLPGAYECIFSADTKEIKYIYDFLAQFKNILNQYLIVRENKTKLGENIDITEQNNKIIFTRNIEKNKIDINYYEIIFTLFYSEYQKSYVRIEIHLRDSALTKEKYKKVSDYINMEIFTEDFFFYLKKLINLLITEEITIKNNPEVIT